LGIAQLALATMMAGFFAPAWAGEPGGSEGAVQAAPLESPPQDATVMPPAPEAGSPVPRHRQPASRMTVAQKIDENVRRLTRGLDLDAGQQQKLRQILLDQHRQIMALRQGNPAAQGDVAGTTMAIYDQSKARIRAMLTEEQRQKYSAEVPRSELAPAQADLQHWLDLQQGKPQPGASEGGPK